MKQAPPARVSIARRRALIFAGLLPLAACNLGSPPEQSFPPISFADRPQLRLLAAILEVRRTALEFREPPHVEHLMPVPPGEAVERWARERLRTAEQENLAVLLVREASVLEERLPVTGGLFGLFKTEQSERYKARLNAILSLYDASGGLLAAAEAVVERSITVPESASLVEREQVWYRLVLRLLKDFDLEMEQNIRATFGHYLLP